MNAERWEILSEWLNASIEADPPERRRLHAQLAADHPDLLDEAEALAAASGSLDGFLETPAVVLAARELAQEDVILPAGAMIGPYRVVSLIARGGMGDVYRAADDRLHRDVAVKILSQTKTGDPLRVERFMKEARVTAGLDHVNVVRVYDVGRARDHAYLVAELLEGETLRTRIARGAIPANEAMGIATEIADGLAAAHAAGLVHRDLKPENIFVTKSGVTKLLDFGIAKLAQDETVRDGFSTLTGVVLGTAGYLAPEQIRGGAVDARADLFALGALLFEMLTGTRAFGREHMVDTLHAILHDAPSNALAERQDVPHGLVDIVTRLLEKAPEARYQSAGDLRAALEMVAANPALGQRVRIRPRFSRRLMLWSAAAAGLVFVALAASWVWWRQPSPPVRADGVAVRLAVVPLRTIPSSPDNAMLELGLADVFISRLGQLVDIRVLPLTATEKLHEAPDIRQAAAGLGATHLLTGTLQREKHILRANLQLRSVADDGIIWTEMLSTDASSIFSIQDAIVKAVVERLAPRLSLSATAFPAPGTRNTQAVDAYLRGRQLVGEPNPASLRRAAELFQQAVALDDQFADAWAYLGSAYKRMPLANAGVPDALEKARSAATRALQIEPDNAEAHSVLGTVAFFVDRDFKGAEVRFKKALDLKPSNVDARNFLAHLYSNLGREEEALDQIRQARWFDPRWSVPRSLEGQFLTMARRHDEAISHLDQLLEDDPDFWNAYYFRVWALLAENRYDDAILGCEQLLAVRRRIDPSAGPHMGALAHKAYALARLGRTADAGVVLEQMIRNVRDRSAIEHLEALVLHGLGRDEEALRLLGQAIDRRNLYATFLGVDPKWDDLRRNPAFRELMRRANLLAVSDRFRQ